MLDLSKVEEVERVWDYVQNPVLTPLSRGAGEPPGRGG